MTSLKCTLLALVVSATLLVSGVAFAGPLAGLVGLAEGFVEDIVAILRVLVVGWGAFLAFRWWSGDPGAKSHTIAFVLGAAILFAGPGLLQQIAGAVGG